MSNGPIIEKSSRFFYGWIIVAVCFFVASITYGAGFSFGVFLTPFQESFGWSSAGTSVAYSLCLLMYTGFAMLAGWGVDKYGPRTTTMLGGFILGVGLLLTSQVHSLWQLYATYGLIGTGMSCFYAPLMTTVSRWFVKRRGLALGIYSAGIGAGPLIMAPLASYLIATSGWRFSYVVMGSAASLIIAGAWLLKKTPEEIGELPDGEMYNASIPLTNAQASRATSEFRQFSLKEAMGTKAFWLLGSMSLMVGTGVQMMIAHVVAYSGGRGLSLMTAATVLSIVSGTSIAGRIIMGTVSDWIGRRKTLAICLFTEGIMIFWLIGASSVWMLFLFGVVYGFCYGGHTPQIPALIAETVGLRNLGTIMGANSFFWGIGGAFGAVLAGYILDTTGSYAGAFIVGGVAMSSAAAIVLAFKKPQKNK